MSNPLNVKTSIAQLPAYLERLIGAGLVPFIKSSPGMGKSDVVHQLAKRNNAHLIDHRMSTSQPEDMTGLPEFYTDDQDNRRARFAPFGDLFPLEGDPLPKGKDGWILFLDEFNSADRRVMAAAYKLILDRGIGQFKLHPKCAIVLAGNLLTDKAIVSPIGSALQSRVAHLDMEINTEAWIEWAWSSGIDERIISFIGQFGASRLMDFNPDHKDNTFCCPRTWGMMSKLIKGVPILDEDDKALYCSVITQGRAIEFIQYTKVFAEIPDLGKIAKDPRGIPVPNKSDLCFATITMMLANLTEQNFSAFLAYAERMEKAQMVLFIRSAQKRCPRIVANPDYARCATMLAKMLRGG